MDCWARYIWTPVWRKLSSIDNGENTILGGCGLSKSALKCSAGCEALVKVDFTIEGPFVVPGSKTDNGDSLIQVCSDHRPSLANKLVIESDVASLGHPPSSSQRCFLIDHIVVSRESNESVGDCRSISANFSCFDPSPFFFNPSP